MSGEKPASSRVSRWRLPLLVAASATALSLVVFGLVGEWAARYRERTRPTVPGTMSKLFYRHGRLLHGMERGSNYYGWVQIGRQGFRGPRDVSVSHPDSTFRIIAVGGSTTFDGNTWGDSSAWTARLERVLDSVAAPMKVEVLNAGVPGFQLFDDLVRLELELYRYTPDLIILYQGHNDLSNALAHAGQVGEPEFDPRPGQIPTIYPWERWLEDHSLLYHKLRSRWEAIRFRSSGRKRGATATLEDYRCVIDSGVVDYGKNMRMFLAAAQSLGIAVVVPQVVYSAETRAGQGPDSVVRSLWSLAHPSTPPEIVWGGYARYDSVARAAAASYGALHVPASDRDLWLVDAYTRDDPIHFNNQGSWEFARHLAAAVGPLISARRRTN